MLVSAPVKTRQRKKKRKKETLDDLYGETTVIGLVLLTPTTKSSSTFSKWWSFSSNQTVSVSKKTPLTFYSVNETRTAQRCFNLQTGLQTPYLSFLPRFGAWDILRWEMGDAVRWVFPFSSCLYLGLWRSQRSSVSQASLLMPMLVRLTARAIRAGRLFGWSSKHLDGDGWGGKRVWGAHLKGKFRADRHWSGQAKGREHKVDSNYLRVSGRAATSSCSSYYYGAMTSRVPS